MRTPVAASLKASWRRCPMTHVWQGWGVGEDSLLEENQHGQALKQSLVVL